MTALQEFFSSVSLRRLFAVERYHQKLAKVLNEQLTDEKQLTKNENVTTEVLSKIYQKLKCNIADIMEIYT